jgi:hypothetical protein
VPAGADTISERHPGDVGIGEVPAVLFHDDFEAGWGRWGAPRQHTTYLHLEDGSNAHLGDGYLRSTVTTAHLQQQMYISSSTRVESVDPTPGYGHPRQRKWP